MENHPLVSVIIPTFNRKQYLLETVYSIFSQTYKEFEIIVIDDGSLDGTSIEINKLCDNRIKYLNYGRILDLGKLRNIGIYNSRGNIIAFCDDDDKWIPNKLETQIPYLNEYGLVCSNASIIDEKGDIQQNKMYDVILNKDNIRLEHLLLGNFIITSSVIVKKSILRGGFEERNSVNSAEDYELWLKISENDKICYLDQPLVLFRRHSNTSSFYTDLKYSDLLKQVIKRLSIYKKYNDSKIRTYARIGIFKQKKELCKVYLKSKLYIDCFSVLFSFLQILFYPKVLKYFILNKIKA